MPTQLPGDILLDRYLSNSTHEEREVARENLRRLARLLIRVHERLSLDNPPTSIRAMEPTALESGSLPTST